MTQIDRLYGQLLAELLAQGSLRDDRTKTGTLALFGRTLELDLSDGFPLLGLRQLSFRIVAVELQWMLRGIDDPNWLLRRDVHLWAPWTDDDAGLGPTIGRQWRSWPMPSGGTHDQLEALLEGLRQRPHSRRHLLSAWNVADLPDESVTPQTNALAGRMALAPCLVTQQFFVEGDSLSLMVQQRSADALLGLPIDIAGSALLLHLIARWLGLVPRRLLMCLGDVHLYLDHLEHARTILQREPRASPRLVFHDEPKRPDEYEDADVTLVDYTPHPAVKAQPSV